MFLQKNELIMTFGAQLILREDDIMTRIKTFINLPNPFCMGNNANTIVEGLKEAHVFCEFEWYDFEENSLLINFIVKIKFKIYWN